MYVFHRVKYDMQFSIYVVIHNHIRDLQKI